jgi:hypothetical protein
MHYQVSPNCSQFLKEYRQITETVGIVTLTFDTPPKVTGRVLIEGDARPAPAN